MPEERREEKTPASVAVDKSSHSMSLDHLRQFHTYVNYDANILLSNSQLSVRRITAITEKHTDNENVPTRAQRIKQTNNHHHHHQWPPPIPIRTHAYRHTGALTPSSRPEEDSMTAHHRHTRRQSLGPNDRPSAAYTRTHRVEDGYDRQQQSSTNNGTFST